MSVQADTKRLPPHAVMARKGGTPLVCLTAYTAPMARYLDPHVDVLLVGDSVGMVLYGMETTLPVSLDIMIAHGRAVAGAARRACVVVDLPFGTYQESPEQAFRTAARVLAETGAAAVKLEGGTEMAPTIRFLVQRGVPVMGHVGLTPQSCNTLGGFRARGRTGEEARQIHDDALAVAEAGAFSVVLEAAVEPLARTIAGQVPVPVIGIGASVACDGQILVTEDMLGLFDTFTPRFVRRYAELGTLLSDAVAGYAADVRARVFPGPEHCFAVAGKAQDHDSGGQE
ncbi:3-methyl-2-oxobutanoate hydroxymethyltransferase [Haematospirillum sp. 15-248]|uniref:3-methyl-2-oxobutanoate hydroxymethyltransferase n=1 Tax=Haematospirillum sp. 15-248 TaxID=2723107 RepID=UPI00143A2F9A|nr:3-methyl-2-oxobutanoate hydroxymethyltransferase [Haematospirillum sp. 15-248]NKD87313.1 3-methyl-2-oxobutanoate hydroxymethyltransferase [Haematospirillum sp. 15-248]